MVSGQQAEAERVFKRIGDLSYRNLGILAKIGLFDTGSLLVTNGLVVVPVSGMILAVGSGVGIQRLSSGDLLPFVNKNFVTLTVLQAADGVPRTDIIEVQVINTAVKDDTFDNNTIDLSTGLPAVIDLKRDIAYSLSVRNQKGTTTPTAATAGILTGTVEIASTIDLSVNYLFNIADGEDGSFIEVDLRGAVPMSTTKAEIVSAINTAIGRTIASAPGNFIILTGTGTGQTSTFEIRPPLTDANADALKTVFGLPGVGAYYYVYSGTNEWVKIAEITIGAATTTITAGMIKDISQKGSWTSLASEVVCRSPFLNEPQIQSWVTNTYYSVNDIVLTEYGMFQCLLAHTSGVEFDDLISTKWVMINVGAVPTADNSTVGTDGLAFKKSQTILSKNMNSGAVISPIISTYSLAYTAAGIYAGGVLAADGSIHMMPFSAAVGQKIVNGVVSTYSLILTTTAAYTGGVLSSDGSIHMIPNSAPVGQKISASGVVSTYSLIYTGTTLYFGGVLAPDGSIHFVPASATVGQSISASGSVSTYSLAYTTTTAYGGGVLASDGSIHLVPRTSTIGQKISIVGTNVICSTYTIASTGYVGGVLAPDGSIHFVPNVASVGQKISATGVVSTYSLIYTTSGAYLGGVLAPDGSIHFVPNSATVGQKVSAAGVVSTYSLAYTTTTAYRGGVLLDDGSLFFMPMNASVGQKIDTFTKVSKALYCSPHFNKF